MPLERLGRRLRDVVKMAHQAKVSQERRKERQSKAGQ